MPSVSSEMSERIPLQASATSSVVFARTSTLPSRSTGMSAVRDRDFADARRQELQRERDLVEDDRRQRNHQQQKRERKGEHRRCFQPKRKRMPPASTPSMRDAGEEQLRAENAGEQDKNASRKHDQAEPAWTRRQVAAAAAGAPRRSTAPSGRSGSRASSCRRRPSRRACHHRPVEPEEIRPISRPAVTGFIVDHAALAECQSNQLPT